METVLHSFATGSTPDGANPEAALVIGENGVLYGTTSTGGDTGNGTVFQLAPPAAAGGAWTETVLHNFTGADGSGPQATLLIDNRGSLFGTTVSGGAAGDGTVFVLNPPASAGATWTENVLHSFTGRGDGANPFGPVILVNGLLYGTTNSGYGTIFDLKP
jgi:uncharacterized repeat protein (TIGR03803 family)